MLHTIELRTEDDLTVLRALMAGRLKAINEVLRSAIPEDQADEYTLTDVLNKRAKLAVERRWLTLELNYGTDDPEEFLSELMPSGDTLDVAFSENPHDVVVFAEHRRGVLLKWMLGLPVRHLRYHFEPVV